MHYYHTIFFNLLLVHHPNKQRQIQGILFQGDLWRHFTQTVFHIIWLKANYFLMKLILQYWLILFWSCHSKSSSQISKYDMYTMIFNFHFHDSTTLQWYFYSAGSRSMPQKAYIKEVHSNGVIKCCNGWAWTSTWSTLDYSILLG